MAKVADNSAREAEAVKAALASLESGDDLDRGQARRVMAEMLGGRVTPAGIEQLLTLLHRKGESVAELAGFAEAMRQAAQPLFSEAHPRPAGLLADTCGTGGDGRGTFNISTAAALVIAGAGVRVAKHGNRAITSRCGSADVLEALGVAVSAEPPRMADCIREVGIGFLFAPHFHAATRHVQSVRRKLPFRTVFNLLGPLTNPAGVDAQVVGVPGAEWLEPMAQALGELGVARAFVVHSRDGMDEVSLAGETSVAELDHGTVRRFSLTAEDFGLPRSDIAALAGGDAEMNAGMIRGVLAGEGGPPADVVTANAALALVAAGAAEDFKNAADLARETIRSGAATRLLGRFVDFLRAGD